MKAMLYCWGLGISLIMQEYVHTTGAIFAMVDLNRPKHWWVVTHQKQGFEFTSYKPAMVGMLVKYPPTRLAATRTKEGATLCPYCQKYVKPTTDRYTTEETIGIHLFFCPFATKEYGKTLIQNQPNIKQPLDAPPNNYQQRQICLGPVPDKSLHGPLCAARWLAAPKKKTATFCEGQCKTCGTIYLPDRTYALPPGANIKKEQATTVEITD